MTQSSIRVFSHSDLLEQRLTPFAAVLGEDLPGYRGHLYRVLTYAMHFLAGDQTYRGEIETALVYHDIAVWTDRTLDYLTPSAQLCLKHNQEQDWGYDPTLLENIILYHHKITRFRGPGAEIVNAVRKGDWIDAYQGLLRKGLSRDDIEMVSSSIPHEGFYDTLARLNKELNGLANLFKVLKW